jgi:hypothetical protein
MLLPMAVLVGGLLAMAGVIMGAFLDHWLGFRRDIRQGRRNRIDSAITAVAQLQAARHTATATSTEKIPFLTDEESGILGSEFRLDGTRTFVRAANECRAALAAVADLCPAVSTYIDRFEVAEDDAPEVIKLLSGSRP